MADQTTQPEVTETASPAAPAQEQAAAAATSADLSPKIPAPENQATAESAAEDAWLAKKDDAAPATSETVEEQETQADASDNAAPTQPATTPDGLDADVQTALKRAGMDADVFRAMPEAARFRWYTTEVKRQSDFDRFYAQRQQQQPAPQQGQQPPAAQGQQPGQPPAQQQTNQADPLKKLEEEYGADYVAPLRAAFDAQQSQIQQASRANEQLMSRLAWDDFDKGIADVQLPAGVDIKSPEVKTAIMKQAAALAQVNGLSLADAIAQGFLRHAVPQAAASLYHKEILAGKTDQQKAQQAKNLRGSPTRTSVIPKTRTEVPASESEAEARWLDENKDAA